MLAIVKITGITGMEISYLQKQISWRNVSCNKEVLQIGDGELSFVEVIEERDYADGYIDHWMKSEIHEIVSRYRTMTRVTKDATVPFARHCEFLIFPEASMPIDYTAKSISMHKQWVYFRCKH